MDPLQFCLTFIVLIIIIIIAALAMTNRIIFKMAVRNFSRRKLQSLIVICGLMIGTAIISSALVVRDTMKNAFEEEVYASLGEVDEEILGVEGWSTVVFFKYYSESIYESMEKNLSSSNTKGFESIVPVIEENVALFDHSTQLGEPSASVIGLDSRAMRNSAFGDLDGNGFYTDSLADGEVAVNSNLAEDIDASEGDTIVISYGVKDPANHFGTSLKQSNFTIAKIIDTDGMYGKANFNLRNTVFIELDVLQDLLNWQGEINNIWVTNKGDYKEGEQYSDEVTGRLQEELDNAVGMSDLGLSLEIFENELIMTSEKGFFPMHQTDILLEESEGPGTVTMVNLMVPTVAVDGNPTQQLFVMGVDSSEPSFPEMLPDTIYFLNWSAAAYGISDGMEVDITTQTLAGIPET